MSLNSMQTRGECLAAEEPLSPLFLLCSFPATKSSPLTCFTHRMLSTGHASPCCVLDKCPPKAIYKHSVPSQCGKDRTLRRQYQWKEMRSPKALLLKLLLGACSLFPFLPPGWHKKTHVAEDTCCRTTCSCYGILSLP